MLDDRKLDVLRAIVEDYVSTQEPVGSKALVERHRLGVSPATVRNDMAVLEEEGFITQPHTSAGRIPTDKGYRLFVDKLTTVKALSGAEKRAIATFLQGAVDLDDVVHRSVRLLAQLTQQVAIVQYPTLARSTVRHVEVVTLSPTRLLLVLITSTGRVEQRVVELPKGLDDDVDRRPAGPAQHRRRRPAPHRRRRSGRRAARAVPPRRQGGGRPDHRRLHRGRRRRPHRREGRHRRHVQPGPLRRGLRPARSSRCSRRSRSTSCCSSCSASRRRRAWSPCASATRCRTSSSPPPRSSRPATVRATQSLAALGVLGPTRMDYPGSMAAVNAVARYISQILADA